MRRFEPYPIYINHTGTYEAGRQKQLRYFTDPKTRDPQMVAWLKHTGEPLYATIEDKTPDPAARKYEDTVCGLLKLIVGTRVGRLVLDSLDKKQQYWIVPLDAEDAAMCDCAAFTFPEPPKRGGGIRVYFNPGDAAAQRWMTADDVLFHEMVHAYRYGRLGYNGMNRKSLAEYDTAEEFLALHLQNSYLADRGSARFYHSYRWRTHESKGTAYRYYARDAEVLMAFRYFVENEPVAKAVAQWTHPPSSYNPWRDQPVLERMYLSGANLGLSRLPPF